VRRIGAFVSRELFDALHPRGEPRIARFERQNSQIERRRRLFRSRAQQGFDEGVDRDVGGADRLAAKPRRVVEISFEPLELGMRDCRGGADVVSLLRRLAEVDGSDDALQRTVEIGGKLGNQPPDFCLVWMSSPSP